MGHEIPTASSATQTRTRSIIRFVCAGMYLYSAALGVVVGLKVARQLAQVYGEQG